MKTNNSTIYKFRAECTADAQSVRAVLLPWLLDWREVRDNIDLGGERYAMPGVDIELSLVTEAPVLGEILWLLDGIDNCHVASDTFDTAESYTGDRKHRERFGDGAQQPRRQIIGQASAAIRARQKALNMELERALHTHKTYDAASRAGNKWQPFTSSEPSPGWLVGVADNRIGLTAMRRVTAPIGCKNWQKKGDSIVNMRLLTIAA